MPEGPIFSEDPVGSPIVTCRAGAKKAASWDMACLLKILCAKNKDVIDHVRNNVDLYKVDRVYFDDPYFDGAKWTTKHFEAGGTSGGSEITFLSKDSCEDAATTLYHETWHDKQPADMVWPHPSEDDAYYQAELWTIEQGLPGQAWVEDAKGKPIKDAKGKLALIVGSGSVDSEPLMNEEHKMDEMLEATITGDGPPVRVTIEEARAMAGALVRAVNDHAMLSRSKAPSELLKGLPDSVGDAELTRGGQVRAGEWLAVSTASGLRWEYRLALPSPPRVGLAFRAPLVRESQDWRVTAIEFLRIR